MNLLRKKLIKHKKLIQQHIFIGDAFPKQLGLDSILESWDLKIRIPRRKPRIWSYSQVETRRYRSKYLNMYFVICFFVFLKTCFLNWFIVLSCFHNVF